MATRTASTGLGGKEATGLVGPIRKAKNRGGSSLSLLQSASAIFTQ
jgi:hypothetical protein